VLDQLLVYHPSPWEDRDWARLSRLPLEEVWFKAHDGPRLFGWYVPATGLPAVLLWCHGNAGNIIHRLENLAALHRMGLSVLLFDYRGYGRSEGMPSEPGLYQDALAAYEVLITTKQVPPERVVLFGRSLGAAVAGTLASQRPAAGLILESAFPSVAALARFHYWGLPMDWLVSAAPTRAGSLRGGAPAEGSLRRPRGRPQRSGGGRGRSVFRAPPAICERCHRVRQDDACLRRRDLL